MNQPTRTIARRITLSLATIGTLVFSSGCIVAPLLPVPPRVSIGGAVVIHPGGHPGYHHGNHHYNRHHHRGHYNH
jgi:hypothetical protein